MRKLLSTLVFIAITLISAIAQENPMEGLCFNPDKPAEFPGGKVAMGQYFSENLEYPTDAFIEGIEGRVMCQFIIQPDSSRTNINIVRKVHPSIDAEMRRLVENMPNGLPPQKTASL
ncbi:MAG: energy transducer TonB [Paludibacteraceae bacterium]|nr:energy transducer TonB [Paludibacteraceae bacterium]